MKKTFLRRFTTSSPAVNTQITDLALAPTDEQGLLQLIQIPFVTGITAGARTLRFLIEYNQPTDLLMYHTADITTSSVSTTHNILLIPNLQLTSETTFTTVNSVTFIRIYIPQFFVDSNVLISSTGTLQGTTDDFGGLEVYYTLDNA